MRLPAALLPLLLLACAAPAPAPLAPIPPEEARFSIPALLPDRPLREVRRAIPADGRSLAEQFRFATGWVQVQHTHAGSKLTDRAIAEHGERDRIEAWARGLRFDRALTDLLSADRAAHERFRGDGWLLRFATSRPGVECTAGRAHLSIAGRDDDRGFTHDTLVSALFCQPAGPAGADVADLFRRLPAPRE